MFLLFSCNSLIYSSHISLIRKWQTQVLYSQPTCHQVSPVHNPHTCRRQEFLPAHRGTVTTHYLKSTCGFVILCLHIAELSHHNLPGFIQTIMTKLIDIVWMSFWISVDAFTLVILYGSGTLYNSCVSQQCCTGSQRP